MFNKCLGTEKCDSENGILKSGNMTGKSVTNPGYDHTRLSLSNGALI